MRLLQLDMLRCMAIILMVIFNWSFALKFLGIIIESDPTHAMRLFSSGWLYWFLLPRAIGASFITIAGISLALSYERVKDKQQSFIYKKYLKRGLKILGIGILITIVTYLSFPSYTIWFGILHLIGLSVLISMFFLKKNKLALLAGLLLIAIGVLIQPIRIPDPYLLFLGIAPFNYTTFDYFPLLPWAGFMLIGMFIGKNYFVKLKSVENKMLDKSRLTYLWYVCSLPAFLGRHSLLVYLLHQPLLLAALYLLGFNIII